MRDPLLQRDTENTGGVVHSERPKSHQPNMPPGQRNPMWMNDEQHRDRRAVDVQLQPLLRRSERARAEPAAQRIESGVQKEERRNRAEREPPEAAWLPRRPGDAQA